MKDLVNAESPWRDRLRALRNMPPVLRILWESGPMVVSWGVGLRVIVAVLPFAVAKVAQYIITDIAGVLRGGIEYLRQLTDAFNRSHAERGRPGAKR